MNVPNVRETQRRHQVLRSQRGSTAIEFALILPVIATLLFGMIDFGRLLYTKEVLNNAVREAARTGIVAATTDVPDSVIDTAVTNSIQNSQLLDPANITGIQKTRTADGAGNRNLAVTVAYTFNFLVVGGLIPGLTTTQTLNSQSTMRMELGV
jgi:Flp pilus assembly protein TadG